MALYDSLKLFSLRPALYIIIQRQYGHEGAWGSVVVKATSRTVPGSIPGVVTGFFSDIFPSDQTMALGLTQPVVKMNTRNIPGGKGGRCVRLTTYHHTVPLSVSLNFLEPSGPAQACYGRTLPSLDIENKVVNVGEDTRWLATRRAEDRAQT